MTPRQAAPRSAVIVGTSVAGVRAAQALRRAGYAGTITLIGQESELPYDKPPLSKGVLAGAIAEESIVLLAPVQARELDLTLRQGSAAVRLDIAAGQVVLADDCAVQYDDLVIATGARARRSPWNPGSGVHILRSIDDCRALRTDLDGGGHIVVVGAGFIGSEVASTCRALGHRVTLIDPVPIPMERIVGPDLGQRMVDLHQRHGVTTRFGAGVEAITGTQGDLTVSLTDGTAVSCATVIVGIGATPNDEWLAGSGLLIDNGVVCDEFGRTSAPAIYSLGDVARWNHPRRQHAVRPEHWTNAVDQARCVAAIMTAPETATAHDPVEFVWSDQYDWKMHIVGDPARVGDGEPAEQTPSGSASVPGARAATRTVGIPGPKDVFATLYGSHGGLLRGAVIVNWPKVSITLRRAMAGGSAFDDAINVVTALRPAGS